MPIRINLLAEAQGLEDMRRRDPVKRLILAGLVVAGCVLAYSSSLQLKSILAKTELNRLQQQVAAHNAEYEAVLANQKKLADATSRLAALEQMTTNRLLHGNVLNALQHVAKPEIQFTRFRTEQSYLLSEAVKPKTNGNKVVPGRPARATERILLAMEARDVGPGPGDNVNVFRQSITNLPFFFAALGGTNEVKLASLSPPQPGPDGKPCVQFTLECRYPERTR